MKRSLQVLCTFLLVFMGLNAQRYPITVIPRVNPPAPVNFFNYADASTINSPLTVQLLLNDITITNRQITLKVYFEGNGIQFQSKDFVVGAPTLTISGGQPERLSNVELAPYFELQNIIGINPNTYGQVIPEGSYQFCFEVFDFTTGNKLSDRTCATTYIFRNDPPILNLPANKVNLEPQPVDNIVFQWTPRHINVSNVEYELSIVEIWDDSVDPQTAFLTSPPIFQTTTRANTFIYGPSNPPLLTDKRYAWQVRAKALQGAEEVGLFRNEGRSEIFWFSRTEPCSPPDNIYAEAKGISKINVFWEENPAVYTEYSIAYRESNKPGAQWFTITTNSGWATVWDLKPGTTYEYKVKARCKYQYSEYSQIQEITTDTTQDENSNYNCGIVPDAIAINNREPHGGLQVGDRITAGDFVITLTEIESSNGGRITGKGYVKIPYLEFARFGVRYENILVNTDKQLAEGEIVTLYDPQFGEGEQMDQDIDLDLIEIINGDDGELTYVDVDFDIQDITINDDGAIVITGENGEEAIIPGGEDVVITDSDGTAWTVGEDGTVTQDSMADGGAVTADNTSGVQNGEVTSLSANGVKVRFKKSGFYAFDQYTTDIPDPLKNQYESLSLPNGEEYKIGYKAIANIKGEDLVEAEVEITDQNITKDDIIFKTKQGIEIPVTWKDNLATLSIKKKFEYAKEEILAVVKPKSDTEQYQIAGKLNLMHLGSDKVSNIKVVVIPVNNSSIASGLKDKVNNIYNKAGVHFDISITNSINVPQQAWDLNANAKFDVGDSSVLSYYSDEENALNSYIKERINYQEETYYILVFDQPLSEASLSGFMPLKSQFGFAFGSQDQARVIAHELGHGVFGIEHPFTKHGIPEGSTDLLMDYGGGSELNHLDWKQIHAPGLQLYWFQGDEEGAYTHKEFADKAFQIIRCAYLNAQSDLIEFSTNVFGKKGRFPFKWRDGSYVIIDIKEGDFSGMAVYDPVELYKGSALNWRFSLLYKNVEIYTPRHNSGADPKTLLEIRDYLFPKDKSQVKKEAEDILYAILNKTNLSESDFADIKTIANCGVQYFNAEQRYQLISKIVYTLDQNKDWLTEYYEDLILDLIETIPQQDVWQYSNQLLEYLQSDIKVLNILFKQINDSNAAVIWKGNDDNFTRFIQAIYKLWMGSGFTNESLYSYNDEIDENGFLSTYYLHYDGKSWFPDIDYEKPALSEEFFTMEVEKNSKPIGKLKYKHYQPVTVIFENGDNSKATHKIPAIFFAGTVKKDDLNKSLDQAGLVFDVALTLTAVGNFTKLRHLSKLHRIGRVTMGTVDITNSFLSMIIKYGDLEYCNKNKEFCDTFVKYSTYLQLGLLGGGIIEAKIVATRLEAKEAYLTSRYKMDEEEVKILDEHFKVNVSDLNWLDSAPAALKNEIASNVDLRRLFEAASDFYRSELIESWKILEGFSTIRNVPFNLETLATIHYRFTYQGKESFEGLKLLLVDGSPASKKKLIEGLSQVDKIFEPGLPVTFTGVKAGDVKVIATKDGVNDEVARYVDGVLQKRKIIEEPDASDYEFVGKYGDADILRKGDEIGFRKITNSSYDQFFKNVGEFSATYDKTGTVSPEIRDRAFELYKQGDWKELEKLFNQNSLNDGWPPANGGYNIEDNVAIVKGQKYDRYGGAVGVDEKGNPILVGTFTSPINGTPYSFTQRALNKSEREYDFYYEIEVIKDLPFTAQNADIIPWYGFEGKGKQSMWKIPLAENGYEKTWNQLAEEGYVKITIISSPSNKFSDKVGTVIQN